MPQRLGTWDKHPRKFHLVSNLYISCPWETSLVSVYKRHTDRETWNKRHISVRPGVSKDRQPVSQTLPSKHTAGPTLCLTQPLTESGTLALPPDKTKPTPTLTEFPSHLLCSQPCGPREFKDFKDVSCLCSLETITLGHLDRNSWGNRIRAWVEGVCLACEVLRTLSTFKI